MTRAFWWKDFRELRAVWVAVVAVTAIVIGCYLMFMKPVSPDNLRQICHTWCIVLAGIYGLVCGSMLLAGEREERTLDFLDSLPGRRKQVWRAKVAIGCAFVLAQVAVQIALLAAFRQAGTRDEIVSTALVVLIAAVCQ